MNSVDAPNNNKVSLFGKYSMTKTLPQFNQASVLIIGDTMLDRYWHGDTNRISPEAPVPIVKVPKDNIQERPGGAANVALNVSALGCDTHLMAITGIDKEADNLTRLLQNPEQDIKPVNCHFVRSEQQPTINKLRIISRGQQLLRVDFEEQFSKHNKDQLNNAYKEFLITHQNSLKAVIISDYQKSTLHQIPTLIHQANQFSIPVLIDPKGNDFTIYKNATLLTPNLTEFEAIVGTCDNETDIVRKGEELMKSLELSALLVTRGKDGMTLLRLNHPAFHLKTNAREVFDVTGAGDTVIATTAAMLACQQPLEQAVDAANKAAGLVVRRLGTVAISQQELAAIY